jgi:hypothetical protein
MPTIDDLIDAALGQQPTQFASVFDNIMGEKAAEAIDAMRTSVAQGIYASEDELEPDDLDDDEDDDLDDDDLDDEIDDDEFDDIEDLDLDDDDDLDLDDEEGFEDGEDA